MKILICSQGSEQGERAMRFGAALAAGCHADVTLLGIMETAGKHDALLDSLRRGQALLLDRKIPAELITKSGDAVKEILNRTLETKYDLVVIGAVLKGNQGPFWMSSKSYQIIKAISPPILLVTSKSGGLHRILLCSAGHHHIETGVKLTAQIAHGMGASVNLLHVLPKPPEIYAHLPRMEQTAARILSSPSELGVNLRRQKEVLESLGVAVEFQVRRGPVLHEILSEVHAGNYDLVVTGSAPSHMFRTYILGDVTREIVNRAPCAVLVTRSQFKPLEHFLPFAWFKQFRSSD